MMGCNNQLAEGGEQKVVSICVPPRRPPAQESSMTRTNMRTTAYGSSPLSLSIRLYDTRMFTHSTPFDWTEEHTVLKAGT